jgi:hypothetical protein
MRLFHIQPHSITHRVSADTKVFDLERITIWLNQWTVPNNYGQTIVDLDNIGDVEAADPFKWIPNKFMNSYSSLMDGKAGDHVLDDFYFKLWIRPIVLGQEFWPKSSSGYQQDFTLRQLTQGVCVHVGNNTISERAPYVYKAFLATLPTTEMSLGDVENAMEAYMRLHHEKHEPIGKYDLLVDAVFDCNDEKLIADTTQGEK